MPFSTHPINPAYQPTQPLPRHLDHRPVFALPYQAFDGPWAGNTDVQYISVGIAQYDPDDVSVKIMRHTGSKWTRQAEELPLHRPIDMTLFLAKAIFDSPQDTIDAPKGTLLNQASDMVITKEQLNIGEQASYNAATARNSPIVKDRLNALLTVLNDLKARGNI